MISSLWAITLNTLRFCVRRQAPIWILLLLGLIVPAASHYLFTGDTTLASKLKLMLSFNFSVFSVVLMILVIYLSGTVLDADFREMLMVSVAVKPIPRPLILAGKLLAFAILFMGLILWYAIGTYGALSYAMRPAQVIALRAQSPDTNGMNDAQRLADAHHQRMIVSAQLWTARTPFYPSLPPLEEQVERVMSQHIATPGSAPALDREVIHKQLAELIERNQFTILYTKSIGISFRGLPVSTQPLTMRYDAQGTRGDKQAAFLTLGWRMNGTGKTRMFNQQTESRVDTPSQFNFPGQLIQKDGILNVEITNLSGPIRNEYETPRPAATINLPIRDGIWVLVPSGSFPLNYAKGWLLLWIRLMMIAAIGVGANVFLGGSVTTLLLIAIIWFGALNAFTQSALEPKSSVRSPSLFAVTMLHTLTALPDFADTNPLPYWSDATNISPVQILKRALLDIGVRGGFFFLCGIIAFRRKEVGMPRE